MVRVICSNHQSLGAQLRQLQADGVLARKATADVPPKVTYFLTREGQKLVPLMEGLCSWGSKHFGIKPTLTHAS
jgi:DNA-binding HxlR family transcriptional regulator